MSTKLQGGIPVSVNGHVEVALQDQDTRMVAAPLHIDLNTGSLLAVVTAVGDQTVTLTAGHGAVIGNVLVLREGIRWFYAGITNVAVNVLTLDTPVDSIFTVAGCSVSVADANLNKNGSITAVESHVLPPPGAVWDITRLHLIMIDASAMDFTTFGGVAALANGVVFGKCGGDDAQQIANAKTNGDLILFAHSYSFQDKVGGGSYAFAADYQFGGQSGAGVVIRLDEKKGETLSLIIQDNLTGLVSFRVVAIGHVVED